MSKKALEALEALEAENARLREEIAEYADLSGRLARLLDQVAIAMKGPPAKHVWHDWSDLPLIARRWRNAGWGKVLKDSQKEQT